MVSTIHSGISYRNSTIYLPSLSWHRDLTPVIISHTKKQQHLHTLKLDHCKLKTIAISITRGDMLSPKSKLVLIFFMQSRNSQLVWFLFWHVMILLPNMPTLTVSEKFNDPVQIPNQEILGHCECIQTMERMCLL